MDKCFFCQERKVLKKYDSYEGKDIDKSREFCDLTTMTRCNGLIPECPNYFVMVGIKIPLEVAVG